LLELFSKNGTLPIVLQKNASLSVRIAAEDLQRNLLALSGKQVGFSFIAGTEKKAIVIQTDPTSAPDHPEGYAISVCDHGVCIVGRDELGTVYGIYTFATKCLGIDPLYHFTDIFPSATERCSLENTQIRSKAPAVRFRGWFINDEDFLSGYASCGATRRISYNHDFFKEVISAEMMDVICESALRLGMNTIIPSSFIDILNPDEEAIVATCTQRGLYVSQHHQEPVGVSYFAAENLMSEKHPGKAVSYIANPNEMREIWQLYVEKWAKYEPHVIWQLGLRGRGDRAVWHTDNSVKSSMQERGNIISNAIADQYGMIAKKLGHENFLSTSTLWSEGAGLYEQGHLKIPEKTVTVFGDIGNTQLFGSDFYSVKRKNNHLYGIYYHAGFHHEGPHLTDGVDPHKMLFCYGDAEQNDSLFLSILNVANIRELCGTVRLNAAIVAGAPSAFDMEQYYKSVYPMLYQNAASEVVSLEKAYFNAIGDLGKELGKEILSYTDFNYYEYEALPFPSYPLTDGTLAYMGAHFLGKRLRDKAKPYVENDKNRSLVQSVLEKSEAQYVDLIQRAEAIETDIPKEAFSHYRYAYSYKMHLMKDLTHFALCASKMSKGEDVEKNRAEGLRCLEEMVEMREEFARGKWKNWFSCDERRRIAELIDDVKAYQYQKQ